MLIPSVEYVNFGQSFSMSITVWSQKFDLILRLDPRFVVTSISSRECESMSCEPHDGVAQFTLQLYLPSDVYGGNAYNSVEIHEDDQIYTSSVTLEIPSTELVTLIPPATLVEGEEAIFTAIIRPDREMNLALRAFDSELKGIWNHFSVTIHETTSIPIPVTFSKCGHTTVMLFLFDNDVYDDAYITSAQVGVNIGCKVYLPGVFNG